MNDNEATKPADAKPVAKDDKVETKSAPPTEGEQEMKIDQGPLGPR